MPCYTVQTMSVAFKAQNEDLLIAALNELDWKFQKIGRKISILGQGIVLDLATEQAVLTGAGLQVAQDNLNQLKRAYAMEAVKQLTRKQHWSIKLKAGSATAGELQRRN